MQQHVDEMVLSGAEPEELAVEHVRHARQRMPVPHVAVGEHPNDAVDGKTVRDMRILKHVLVVIKIDELVVRGLGEHQGDSQQQEATDYQHPKTAPFAKRGGFAKINAAAYLPLRDAPVVRL